MSSVESGPLPQSSPFWTFSLGYYRGAGVSEACLELQDNCGIDVNVVTVMPRGQTTDRTAARREWAARMSP